MAATVGIAATTSQLRRTNLLTLGRDGLKSIGSNSQWRSPKHIGLGFRRRCSLASTRRSSEIIAIRARRLLRCMSPFLALFCRASRAEECRLSGVDRPTYAHCEVFAVWTPSRHGQLKISAAQLPLPARGRTPCRADSGSRSAVARRGDCRFGTISTFNVVTPVRLPPGRLRLLTSPSLTGSAPSGRRSELSWSLPLRPSRH
jgi:hypothetical protein